MSEPACNHFDGESFLVRPAIRGPQREGSSKLECPKCGAVWRPARGEYWLHVEEVLDLRSQMEALATDNAQMRQLLEVRAK